jgi:hypothetical protein
MGNEVYLALKLIKFLLDGLMNPSNMQYNLTNLNQGMQLWEEDVTKGGEILSLTSLSKVYIA